MLTSEVERGTEPEPDPVSIRHMTDVRVDRFHLD